MKASEQTLCAAQDFRVEPAGTSLRCQVLSFVLGCAKYVSTDILELSMPAYGVLVSTLKIGELGTQCKLRGMLAYKNGHGKGPCASLPSRSHDASSREICLFALGGQLA